MEKMNHKVLGNVDILNTIYSNICFKTDNWTLFKKSMLPKLRILKWTLTIKVSSGSERHEDQVSGKLVPKIPRLGIGKSGAMLFHSSLLSHLLTHTTMDEALNGGINVDHCSLYL